MSVVLGVDGGNTKTDLLVASLDGELLAYVRGGGSNSHAAGGVAACVDVIAGLVERAGVELPAEHGAFFLCGADVPADVVALRGALRERGWARHLIVDNDTFALLRTGSDAADAVAVVCGAGINCVGRSSAGRVARYPALGWETGDWGGSEALGREALFHAARAEDGRGEPTQLVAVLRSHFDRESVAALGEDVHYRRLPQARLGDVAAAVVDAAANGDRVAGALVRRLADEVALFAWKALRDLDLLDDAADVVLGGGMLTAGSGFLFDAVVERLRERAPLARPVVPREPPVAGAGLAALDAAGTAPEAARRLRDAFRRRPSPVDLRER